jgi:hypothetical protein
MYLGRTDNKMLATFSLIKLRHAFEVRLAEWAFACILLLWGGNLLLPTDVFDGPASPYFTAIRLLVTENQLGTLCLVGGAVRLMVLALNGGWRPLYYLRAVTAFVSSVLWLSLSLGFLGSGMVGGWVAIYPVLFVFDSVNMFRAVGDAAKNEIALNAASSRGIAGES